MNEGKAFVTFWISYNTLERVMVRAETYLIATSRNVIEELNMSIRGLCNRLSNNIVANHTLLETFSFAIEVSVRIFIDRDYSRHCTRFSGKLVVISSSSEACWRINDILSFSRKVLSRWTHNSTLHTWLVQYKNILAFLLLQLATLLIDFCNKKYCKMHKMRMRHTTRKIVT